MFLPFNCFTNDVKSANHSGSHYVSQKLGNFYLCFEYLPPKMVGDLLKHGISIVSTLALKLCAFEFNLHYFSKVIMSLETCESIRTTSDHD